MQAVGHWLEIQWVKPVAVLLDSLVQAIMVGVPILTPTTCIRHHEQEDTGVRLGQKLGEAQDTAVGADMGRGKRVEQLARSQNAAHHSSCGAQRGMERK